jgi:ABC-type Mn2+/Zn2+ transport system ATPase subunit
MQRRLAVAYIPQRPSKGRFPLSVKELLGSSRNPEVSLSIAHDLGLSQLLGQSVSTLSGGQLQRCYVARGIGSLSGGACALVADEPTSALDFNGQKHVAQLLTEIPATLIVVTHERAVANNCDRVFEMASGVMREAGTS